jgi:hypothetical protein
MTAPSQKNASARYRQRSKAQGLVRFEVQAAKSDTHLLRALARELRGEPERAGLLRRTVEDALKTGDSKTAFDIFGSDIADDVFSGVFDQPRDDHWPTSSL